MNTDKQIASKVLDYWFAIEFLGQDSYEMCTNERELIREFKRYKKSSQQEKDKRKQITVFENIKNEDIDVYKIIKSQAENCGMHTWGNLTFYLGKISRQICIEKLAEKLKIQLDQSESSMDEIPVISFQCDNKGQYIAHSLSLSTIVWALSQIQESGDRKISEVLSEQNYIKSIENIEENYFKWNNTDESSVRSEEGINVKSNAGMPEFEPDSITVKKIQDIFKNTGNEFEKHIKENSIEKVIGLKYQLFKDNTAKGKYDDDDYMGLSHDFFSSDIRMVKDDIERGKHDFESGMLADLISYICSPYKGFEKNKKHDLVKDNDENNFIQEISSVLNMKNAPIAKWPSRYMPALMQQIAVNFAVSRSKEGIFKESGCIFSVNGPPGTGKTTLLKEIVASNIVEKAIILSEYEKPDDAFEDEVVTFKKGKFNGAYVPPTNGYRRSPYPGWYKFKNDKVADYGILVTSCNNAAVENITKELPLENGILDNLIANDGDSDEMKKRLSEISQLFSVGDRDNKASHREIYYTQYAAKLFGSGDNNAKAWGLVAAPLGKKSNISSFYFDVLYPVWQNLMMKNKDIEDHLEDYRKARESFLKQLNKVKELKKYLAEVGTTTLTAYTTALDYKKTKKNKGADIAKISACLNEIEEKIKKTRQLLDVKLGALEKVHKRYNEIEKKASEYETKIRELSGQELQYKQQAVEAENSVSFLTKIFRKSRYNAALDLARSYKMRADACTEEASAQERELNSVQKQLNEIAKEKEAISEEVQQKKKEIRSLLNKIEERKNRENQLLSEIKNKKRYAESALNEKNEKLKEYNGAGELKSGQVLDEDFIRQIMSDDEEKSTEAQTANPWTTEEYNFEREKLFYRALQMTKTFLLSSKSCRRNLLILGQYWGLRTENGEKIHFDACDKEAMMGSLLNTLFLLSPVISSTFASVGRFLKDVREPGVIGTLIIDEAGQAQPQMAVGALFRSRKSIIVGDPKQVEPVVTDDLKLLKEAYSDSVYTNYKNKALSVQSCADIINPFGTFLENGTDSPDWTGCPLLVHRRCISPMYEISNRISYNGIMKQKTLPPSEKKTKSFIFQKSQWFNVNGREEGHGNHFVEKQGDLVSKMVNRAFEKSSFPSLFIISPFTSVVAGIRGVLKKYRNENRESILNKSNRFGSWIYSNIGTVHKFQGKEANEVIFVLGCDETIKDGYAVSGFVNSNIVNVAATRAKYRLYVIGDSCVWGKNQYVKKMKSIIDGYAAT